MDDEVIKAVCGPARDGRATHIAHRKSGIPLRTGQVFTFKAKTPEERPSFDLLLLQWNLVQVAAMSGAADVYEAGNPDYTLDEGDGAAYTEDWIDRLEDPDDGEMRFLQPDDATDNHDGLNEEAGNMGPI